VLALVLGGGSLIAGCGQKGDLYLPKEDKQAAPSKPPEQPHPANSEGRTEGGAGPTEGAEVERPPAGG